jgi:hypothetical protein
VNAIHARSQLRYSPTGVNPDRIKGRQRRSRNQTLKQDPRTASIPVVVISNYPRTEMVPTEGFVGKPCSPDQIIAEVMRVVKDRNPDRPLTAEVSRR